MPELGKHIAYKAHREGVAARCPAPAVQKRLAVALALLGDHDRRLTELALCIVNTAKAHKAQVFDRRRSRPGVGKRLALVRLYARHDLQRFPRGQAFVSYGRLVKRAKESAGKR